MLLHFQLQNTNFLFKKSSIYVGVRVSVSHFQDANSNSPFTVTFVGFRKESSVTMNVKSIIQNVDSAIHVNTCSILLGHSNTHTQTNSHMHTSTRTKQAHKMFKIKIAPHRHNRYNIVYTECRMRMDWTHTCFNKLKMGKNFMRNWPSHPSALHFGTFFVVYNEIQCLLYVYIIDASILNMESNDGMEWDGIWQTHTNCPLNIDFVNRKNSRGWDRDLARQSKGRARWTSEFAFSSSFLF